MGQRIIVSEEEKNQILEKYNIISEQNWLDKAQQIADYVGLVPGIGDAVDFINGIVYFARAINQGNFHPHGLNGLLSFVGIIPVVGSTVTLSLRTLFKGLPVNVTADIIRKIGDGNSSAAANTLVQSVANNPNTSKMLQTIANNKSGISKGVKMIINTLVPIKRLIPGQIDDKIIDFIIKLVVSIGDFLTKAGGNVVSTAGRVVGKLVVSEIPQAYLTRQGRLRLGNSWTSPGKKRFLYSIQDSFKSYLFKQGGMSKLPKDIRDAIHKQAKSNIDKIGQADNYDLYSREFTNLLILNYTKYINDFIGGSGFKGWFNTFIRSMDPKVVVEVKGTLRHLMTSGYKSALVGGRRLEKSNYPSQTTQKQTSNSQSTQQTQPKQRTQPQNDLLK